MLMRPFKITFMSHFVIFFLQDSYPYVIHKKTWYLVLKLCLSEKNVFLATLTRKLGRMFVVKDIRNVKMKLGSLLKNIKLDISHY